MNDFRNSIKVTLIMYEGVDINLKPVGTSTTYEIPSEIRITGDITKTSLAYPNQAVLEFFNLDLETRGKFINRATEVEIRGGKPNEEILFFKGEVRNSNTVRQDVDLITTVYLGSLQRDWDNATLSKTYKTEVPYKTILTDLAKAFPNAKGEPNFEKAPKFLAKNYTIRGVTVEGSVRDSLNIFTKMGTNDPSDDLVYTIEDDGEVIFADASGLIEDVAEFKINEVGQIIGIPEVEIAMMTVKTHFSPQANVFETLNVASEFKSSSIGNLLHLDQKVAMDIAGQKRIRAVRHNFDTRGSGWTTTIQASEGF